jgi:hypothetical protein
MKKSFKFYNNLTGWIVFAIAAFTYLSTIEPSVSLWDCGEFLSTSYKFEVGHPPGAPFFMLVSRLFSLFAPDPTWVPVMINSMSALASAFTILLLFFSITHLARKIVLDNKENALNLGNLIAILGSGVVGALAYTFSDSFWFSAVEAEVYASSSLFTALVFWAILKWEDVADEPFSNRWLILISYLIGLSIGVHLLNLLAIPAIVFVYYFRKYETTRKGIIYATLAALGILGVVMYGVIPGIITVASWFELMFVNGFGLGYNSGFIFYMFLLAGATTWAIYYTYKKQKVLWNTVLWMFAMIVIGYSSFAIVVIRANTDTPLDENNPDNVFSLLAYLNRDQYGSRPLIYGQYYNAPIVSYDKGDPIYIQKDGKYVISSYKDIPVYDSRFNTLFPRMWSSQANHIKEYKTWANVQGIPIQVTTQKGTETRYKPTFGENLKFFIVYQLGHMYFRYFMWNFSGRQNDIQGHGSLLKGNWLSGIPFIDEARLGPQDNLPERMKNNRGRNNYYMLPFLLGLLGMFYHAKAHNKDFGVVMWLFVMTGIAIVVYLNQYPLQPRERDYAYVGSFYAFAIWIGLGVLAIYEKLKDKVNPVMLASGATVITLLAVPLNMAAQNWDDHDRSGRYAAHDFALNYLNSCAPNSILFTNGDNDTFPLWYIQEVEGKRTDVRIVNLSLFNTDWYIDQVKRKAYDSDPIPNSFKHEQYAEGIRDYIPYVETFKKPVKLKDVIEFIKSDDPRAKVRTTSGNNISYLPANQFLVKVNRKNALENGTITPEDTAGLPNEILWKYPKRYLFKGDLMMLDIIAQNDWKRPIYFTLTAPFSSFNGLQDYFAVEGLTYRVTPIKSGYNRGVAGRVNVEIMYDNLMNKFKWGNIEDPHVYLNEDYRRMTMNFRNNFSMLANALMDKGDTVRAKKVLDRCLEVMPNETVPYDYFNLGIAIGYIRLHHLDKAKEILSVVATAAKENLDYYQRFPSDKKALLMTAIRQDVSLYQEVYRVASQYGLKEMADEMEPELQRYYSTFVQR